MTGFRLPQAALNNPDGESRHDVAENLPELKIQTCRVLAESDFGKLHPHRCRM